MAFATAMAIADAARKIASEQQVAGISVVVMDIDGAPRVALRDDAQGRFGLDIATAKARTALGFQRPTAALAAIFTDATVVAGLSACVDGGMLLIAGGVPIRDAQGRRLGSVGVAGGLPSTDHDIARGAVAAVGLVVGT